MIITIIDHMNSKRKAYNLGFKKKLSHNELNMTGKFLQRQFWKFEERLYSYTSACVQTNSLKLVRLWFGFVSITGFLDILRCRYISINSVAIKFIHMTCVIYHENNISYSLLIFSVYFICNCTYIFNEIHNILYTCICISVCIKLLSFTRTIVFYQTLTKHF